MLSDEEMDRLARRIVGRMELTALDPQKFTVMVLYVPRDASAGDVAAAHMLGERMRAEGMNGQLVIVPDHWRVEFGEEMPKEQTR